MSTGARSFTNESPSPVTMPPPFSSSDSSSPERRATVLIVDDDPLSRELSERALMGSHDVVQAESVAEGVEVVRNRRVDLVILDVMMPEVSGIDGCGALKRAAGGRYLPVLLLTALRSQDDRNIGLSAGADDFLSKPIDRRELQLRVATFARLANQERRIRQQMEELRELSALKDDLVEMMVHDLRNPLTAVSSSLSLLKDSPSITTDEDREDVDLALSATHRMARLLEELLQVRLLEEGKLVPQLRPVPLEAVVKNAVDTLTPGATARRITLEFRRPDVDTTVNVDEALLQRAIENLLSNALKYTRQRVDVWLDRSPEYVTVTVADRGPGIPEPLLPRLFSKYASLEGERGEARRGIGLGLYMVRLTTMAHGGTVDVEPREGGGSLFRLALHRGV
ncbi:MAG: hybrid sensor histidine kinase/response regulator [Archangium sp.]